MTESPNPDLGYADALAELTEILDELEDESIDIDVLSSRVERAAQLITHCRQRINLAQEKVGSIVDQLEELAAAPAEAPELDTPNEPMVADQS